MYPWSEFFYAYRLEISMVVLLAYAYRMQIAVLVFFWLFSYCVILTIEYTVEYIMYVWTSLPGLPSFN